MTFTVLWELVESQNKQIATGTVKMSSDNFRRALKFAYDKGADSGRNVSGFGDVFDQMFNGRA